MASELQPNRGFLVALWTYQLATVFFRISGLAFRIASSAMMTGMKLEKQADRIHDAFHQEGYPTP